MNYTPEQELEIFNLSKIYASIVWWILIALLLLWVAYDIVKVIKQNKYFDSLPAEQQKIISKYNHVRVFERKQKHDSNNSNNSTSNN